MYKYLIRLLFLSIQLCIYADASIYKDLDPNRRYNEIMWIGAHNANFSHAYGWGTVNQQVSIETLLNKNVRLFLFDTHFSDDQQDRNAQAQASEIGQQIRSLPESTLNSQIKALYNETVKEIASKPLHETYPNLAT